MENEIWCRERALSDPRCAILAYALQRDRHAEDAQWKSLLVGIKTVTNSMEALGDSASYSVNATLERAAVTATLIPGSLELLYQASLRTLSRVSFEQGTGSGECWVPASMGFTLSCNLLVTIISPRACARCRSVHGPTVVLETILELLVLSHEHNWLGAA